MTQNDMQDTMNAIDRADKSPSLNKRESLVFDISNLKKDIKVAEDMVIHSNDEMPSYGGVSPEEANQSKKRAVFLRRDLAAKETELNQFDQ